jgi:phosphoglucomutase
MVTKHLDQKILDKAKVWLEGNFDQETKVKVQTLIDNDPQELTDAFYRNLEFGTGGLRGIMGVGTNRMNKYTVGMATQGLANYLKKMFGKKTRLKVAIAYDSRNNSRYFAEITADVFSANDIKVFLFDALRPTPELSFAIRHLNCQSGVVITASHNPKEYNGYKAYWNDGGQLIPPHDKNVISEVNNIKSIDDVKFIPNKNLIEIIGKEIDDIYLKNIKKLSVSPEIIEKYKNLKIVYTPLHGTGITLIPECLKAFGFNNIHIVKEQAKPDGDFPTVKSPNPEESSAMELAIRLAREINASLVLATDPDADRVGIAIRDDQNDFILLNGNQTASILLYYLIKKWKEKGKLSGNEYIVKTIVTSELIKDIADQNNVECYDVLTGFKWIAELIRLNEGKKTFIAGGEESYGYLIGDFVRDKDAVSSCALIAEATAWAADQGKTLYDLLIEIALEFDLYKESLLSIVKKGETGAKEIRKIMEDYRLNPPKTINDSRIVKIKDYLSLKEKNLLTGKENTIHMPESNVLQFFLEDGSKISIRPSGTEPKIKYYFEVKEKPDSKAQFRSMDKVLDQKLEKIIQSMGLK